MLGRGRDAARVRGARAGARSCGRSASRRQGSRCDEAERRARGLDLGGRERAREDEAPRRVDEQLAQAGRARDEGAEGAERLAERAHQDVDLAQHAGGLGAAAAVGGRACRCRGRRRAARSRRGRGRASRSRRSARRRRPCCRRRRRRRARAGRRGATRASVSAKASTSPWRKTATSQRASFAPSMIEAWFSASETSTSPGPDERRDHADVRHVAGR